MFERQTRQSFPIFYLILAAAAVLAIAVFLFKKTQNSAAEPNLKPFEWADIAREYPHFVPGVAAKTAALQEAASMAAERGGNGFNATWNTEGPFNIGARVNSIKVHPTNPKIIYCGFSHGGVWKTTDGGQNWLPIFDKQTFLTIGDIELDPQNPEIVYVGTGDCNIGGYVGIGNGLWRSMNGGATWTHLGLEKQSIISKIIIHPTQANVIWVGTMGLPFVRGVDRGLYKSTDSGATWQKVLYVSEQTGVTDILISPDNPNELFAVSWDRIRNNRETLVAGEGSRIWKSTDGGSTWKILTGGLPDGELNRMGLTQSKSNPNVLYASICNSDSELEDILKSSDRGATWTSIEELPGDWGDPLGGFGWYFGKIFVSPTDPFDIYLHGVDLWRSQDGGKSWQLGAPEWWEYSVHADKHDQVWDKDGNVLLGTDGGLYKTSDNGQTWQDIENIAATQLYRVAVNPHNQDFYYGGAQDNGTFGGNSDFTEWARLYGGDGFQAAFHPTDPNIFYFETQNGNIVGTNDGQSFQSGTDGIDDGDRRHWDMQFIVSPHDPDVMYTGTYRIYQGYFHPPTWTPVSDDLTDGVVYLPRFHTISTLDESPVEKDLLYVGTSDGNVWRGNPNAADWVNITAGLPDRYISSVKASPTDADRVFVSITGYRDNDFTPHLFRSDDRGATWTSIAGNLPNLAINDVYILKGHQDKVIVVGTEGGVFATLDAGKNWSRVGSNFPMVQVYDLEINPATKRLVAGTYARSILTYPLDSLLKTVPTTSPADFSKIELSVLPNLVQHEATILLKNLPTGADAEVLIADASGKIIEQKTFRRGTTPVFVLENRGLAAGVYFAFAKIDGRAIAPEKFVVTN